jgi:hypothetical protein
MRAVPALTIAALLATSLCAPASAHWRHRGQHRVHVAVEHSGSDPRPAAWCGWGLKRFLGLHDVRLNLARNWAFLYGHATGPRDGAVVVWPHHVGQIVRLTGPGRALVHSFNDGHTERTRERSLAGAIAFRI